MPQTSTIELKKTHRKPGLGKTKREFLDFSIDGTSLYEALTDRGFDNISCLGWSDVQGQQVAIDRLLCRAPADFLDERISLYICPECGDLDCGAISLIIQEEEGFVVWRDFGFENMYEENIERESLADVGPFFFDKRRYEELFTGLKKSLV